MAARGPRQVTLYDVAREAGVHFTTVSRTLNGTADLNIRPQTRERILAAAERLKYRPNAFGRGLRLSSTHTLGLLVPSLRNPVYAAVVRGAFDQGVGAGLCRGPLRGQRGRPGRTRLRAAGERGADRRSARGHRAARGSGRRAVAEGARCPPSSSTVATEEATTSRCARRRRRALAAAHLLALGHTRLAHIAGPDNLDTAARRVHGFRAAVREAGHRAPIVPVGFDERGGYRAMVELLGRNRPPTGVFVSNINQALGALAAAKRNGVRGPRATVAGHL